MRNSSSQIISPGMLQHLRTEIFFRQSTSDQPKHDPANASALLFSQSFGWSWIGRNLHYSALIEALAISRSSSKQPMNASANNNNQRFSNFCCTEQIFFRSSALYYICGCFHGRIYQYSLDELSIWNNLLRLEAEALVKHRSLGKLPMLRRFTEASLFGWSSGSSFRRSFGSGRSG